MLITCVNRKRRLIFDERESGFNLSLRRLEPKQPAPPPAYLGMKASP